MSSIDIVQNLNEVRLRIAAACTESGRDPASITLVAVSKRKPSSLIRAAYEAGQRDFGENYVQEWLQKRDDLADLTDLRWHMIGNLQTNKARLVAGKCYLIQTIDRNKIAERIATFCEGRQAPQRVLIEVNIASEPNKRGVNPDELARLVDRVRTYGTLQLEGLMMIPPVGEAEEKASERFEALHTMAASLGLSAPIISMGMSDDLENAIRHGATMVRVGTAIFGKR